MSITMLFSLGITVAVTATLATVVLVDAIMRRREDILTEKEALQKIDTACRKRDWKHEDACCALRTLRERGHKVRSAKVKNSRFIIIDTKKGKTSK